MTRWGINYLFVTILWTFILEVELIQRTLSLQPFDNPCHGSLSLRWIRAPKTCKKYIICAAGQPIRMPACPDSHVWSNKGRNCVPKYSRWDDCTKIRPTAFIPQKMFTHYRLHDETAKPVQVTVKPVPAIVATKRLDDQFNRPTHKNARISAIKRVFPNHPCAFPATELVIPHSEKCHLFYNCSLPTNLPEWKYNEPLTQECAYPMVFSPVTRQCEAHDEVDCGNRKVFKNPCEYRENVCRTSHCRPCSVRFGNCEGKPDGFHAFREKEWTPDYIVCRDERSIQQLQCRDPRPIFSPDSRQCEHLKNVPKVHGGLRPVCDGRRDGFYPDESGRCDIYFECSQSQFSQYKKCGGIELFSPEQARCSTGDVEPPCGNVTNNICQGLPDGYYADPYGRCPLYIHCIDHRLLGYLKCPFGSFNPYTERCETSSAAPKPCGNLPNPCLARADGEYADLTNNCVSSYTCKKRFVVKVRNCKAGQVYSEQTGKCGSANLTPSPCGLAPSCNGKPDGRYPSHLKGCEYYYVCKLGRFVNYEKCGWDKGGFYFNPITQTCDFPLNICGSCGTRDSNCGTTLR